MTRTPRRTAGAGRGRIPPSVLLALALASVWATCGPAAAAEPRPRFECTFASLEDGWTKTVVFDPGATGTGGWGTSPMIWSEDGGDYVGVSRLEGVPFPPGKSSSKVDTLRISRHTGAFTGRSEYLDADGRVFDTRLVANFLGSCRTLK